MNLYKLKNDWEDINFRIEILQTKLQNNKDDFETKMFAEKLQNDFENFVKNAPIDIVKNIKNKEGEIEARKTEIKRLQTMNKIAENVIEYNKTFLAQFMNKTGTQNIETDIGKISLRDGAYRVEIENENLIPTEFIRIKNEVDKSTLLKNFKTALNTTGELIKIPGIKFVKGEKSISIK